MKKQLIITLVAILFLVVCLSGCTDNSTNNQNSEENKFIGTWIKDTQSFDKTSITFFFDGTGSYASISINWELKDGKLVIDWLEGVRFIYDYFFSEDINKLTLTDTNTGLSTTYIKQ